MISNYKFKILLIAVAALCQQSFPQAESSYQVRILDQDGSILESWEGDYQQLKEEDYYRPENKHLHRFTGENIVTFTDVYPREDKIEPSKYRVNKIKRENAKAVDAAKANKEPRDTFNLYSKSQRKDIKARNLQLMQKDYSGMIQGVKKTEEPIEQPWFSSTKLNGKEVIQLFNILNQEIDGQYAEYRKSREHISDKFKKNLDQRCYGLLEEIGTLKEQKNITESSEKSAIFFRSCTS